MEREACFQLGQLIRKVGNDGRLLLEIDADDPAQYQKMESVFVEFNNALIPFFLQSMRMINRNQAHVKFKDVDTAEEAELILGSSVFLPLDALPELKGKQFYYHEVIGFEVRNPQGESAGFITDILENGPNDLFKLDLDGREILIPVADEWILTLDRSLKLVTMTWPDGLLDLNQQKKN